VVKRHLIALLAPLLFLSGCHRSSPDAAATTPGGQQYSVRGKVVSTDAKQGEVMLQSEAIPGYMDAMTMPYKLKNPGIVSELHPGDSITAQLTVTNTDSWLDQIVITAQGKPDYKPAVTYHVVQPGDLVPDFELTNQDGKQIHLGQFRGKVLLVTFIYTRCPLPNFCPRMSQNFAAIDKALAADPALYAKTHLLSISFDPDYDTPRVLRSYGGGYTGKFTQETFAHWDFAVPSKANLDRVTRFFDIGVTPEKDQTITHSLSTTVISPDGKVYRWYPTNDWTPEQAIRDIKQLLHAS
jgi:protein SCO1/2